MTYKPKSERLKYLADKWLAGTISEEERIEFDTWYSSYEDHIVTDFSAEKLDSLESDLYFDIQKNTGMNHPVALPRSTPFKKMFYWAASILLIVGIGAFIYTRKSSQPALGHIQASVIVPGSDKGNLQLGDELAYNLDELADGVLLSRSGVEIVKTKEGEINYVLRSKESLDPNHIIESSVATPNGGQYKIKLSDGTRIWLNAASKVKFPIAFIGKERIVELQGEAYFEVAKDAHKPFVVKTHKEEIKVLGTHFNVNAYLDEPISKVSLLEGRVAVSAKQGNYNTVLSPGQQTLNGPKSVEIERFNPEESIAWKNGDFIFNNERLDQVMLRVGRWYDVQVEVDPEIAAIQIWGSISKSEQIDKVLRLVQLTNDHIAYSIEGRRVYMVPK
ncbi:anti-sigma factor [Sphingobacterium sp. ML3W]|uniref:FecR family protein n=1 Tax=Sphingobacterium sp. ML3W TaxID=1538644 RepID=UPI0004F7DDCF|nr:FecR domain-containing protein [Sphingobacterium sp. ML3W]AIM39076.1 anti-sigma factor [Sphingobacterium sp. ML3W]